MKKFLRVLALDYGTKRIGVAVSRGSLAEPLEVVANDASIDSSVATVPSALERIAEICQEEKIEQLLVGLSENGMAERTKKFVDELRIRFDLPVSMFDETLSSQDAEDRLLLSGAKKKKRQGPIDHYSAAIILESWLESR
ncbi:MAG: Holliday junction resolvase RuvX [Patescibacteria group bacterium]